MNALRDFFAMIFTGILAVALLIGLWKGSAYVAEHWFSNEPKAFFFILAGAAFILSALGAAIKINAKK